MDALTELNQALASFQPTALVEVECRFYYDPVTRVGTRFGTHDDHEPFVAITYEEYIAMSSSVASKFYLSKSGKVNLIPVAKGMQKLLECSTTGSFKTIKDCIIFADPNGPDVYRRREFDYD